MQLTDEQIERLRQSGIRLDPEGRFLHEGAEVTHAGLKAALWRWLDRNPDGRYVLRLDDQRFVYLDVDDAPFVIRSLRFEGEQAIALLSDGSEEALDLKGLEVRTSGIAYCPVRNGKFTGRLSPAAWTTLAERILELDGVAYLEVGGDRLRLGAIH